MVRTTTREGRAGRWRFFSVVAAAVLALSTVQFIAVTDVAAQVVKPHIKKHLPTPAKAAAKPTAKSAPADPQEADELNAKWLAEHNKAAAAPSAAVPSTTAASAPSTAVPTSPNGPNTSPTTATTGGEEDKFAVPSFGAPAGTGARALVAGSVSLVTATGTAAFNAIPGAQSLTRYKEVAQAFSGFGPAKIKVEMVKGQTADGTQRLVYASLGEGKNKLSYWWFAPTDQPDGWFDDKGHRLGGTVLAEPKPGSRISSPFGTRRYYGRTTGKAFHNGIDFEGKVGQPIHAAADGVVNHANWYYNYGRTVKITHADHFETLYAHMSRIAPGIAPGSVVHTGDVIGYVGSTGRSTGPHLHFSTIVDGRFVDPAQYLSETGNGQLHAGALVAFRQWQQQVRAATEPVRKASTGSTGGAPHGLHGGEEWSHSPFAPQGRFAPKPAKPVLGHL